MSDVTHMATILFYIPAAGGGTVTVLRSLIRILEPLGYSIKVLVGLEEDLPELLECGKYAVGYVHRTNHQSKLYRRMMSFFNVMTDCRYEFLFVKRHTHDIFVNFRADSNAQWIRYTDKPVLGWFHGMTAGPEKNWKDKIRTWFRRRFFNRHAKLVAITDNVADDWMARYHLNNRPEVIPNYVDVDDVLKKSLATQDEMYPMKTKQIVFVGRVAPDKGIERMLRAVESVYAHGYNFDFWVVGEGPDLAVCHAAEAVNPAIHVLGRKDNPYPYMRAADLLLLASPSEGLGLVLWESLIVGTPVMATRSGGTENALENGKWGVLVPNTEEGIVNGLCDYLSGRQSAISADGFADAMRERNSVIREKIVELFKTAGGC